MNRTPRCLGCGYDLSGLTDRLKLDVRCPECDRVFITGEYKLPRKKLWWILAGNVVVVLVVFAAIPQDACGAPGLGYVGLLVWIAASASLATTWQLLETRGYARRGTAWMFVRHAVLVAIALLFVSLGVAAVKLALSQP